MTKLERARRLFTRRWWGRREGDLFLAAPWVSDIPEFCTEPLTTVRAVAASLQLDGYPARWARRDREGRGA